MDKYYKKDIDFSKILVNPNNARFYDIVTDSEDEMSGMSDIIELNHDHVINLCKDIAANGLLPINNLIVMPIDTDKKYMAYDGNRRLTSLKLISDYKDKLDSFKLTSSEKETIKKLSTNIQKVSCVVSSDINFINNLLYKTHAPETGIGQINWSPQSKAKHLKNASGKISRELAFSLLIKEMDDVSDDILGIIEKGKWTAKLRRFTKNDEFMLLLGIEFTVDSNNIMCYFSKDNLKKTIIPFLKYINDTPASEIAQKAKDRTIFISNFIKEHKIANIQLSNRVYTFYPYASDFNYTIEPVPRERFKEILSKYLSLPTIFPDKPNISGPTNVPNKKTSHFSDNTNNGLEPSPPPNPCPSKIEPKIAKPDKKRNTKIPPFFSGLKWTSVESTETESIPLLLICEELKKMSSGTDPGYKKYPIAATILFRSLVEHCFKYLLRNAMPKTFSEICRDGRDPSLQTIINRITNHKEKLFTNSTLSREFIVIFNTDKLKDFLDLAPHQGRTDIFSLEIKSQNFLKIANYILNTDIENIEE